MYDTLLNETKTIHEVVYPLLSCCARSVFFFAQTYSAMLRYEVAIRFTQKLPEGWLGESGSGRVFPSNILPEWSRSFQRCTVVEANQSLLCCLVVTRPTRINCLFPLTPRVSMLSFWRIRTRWVVSLHSTQVKISPSWACLWSPLTANFQMVNQLGATENFNYCSNNYYFKIYKSTY